MSSIQALIRLDLAKGGKDSTGSINFRLFKIESGVNCVL